MTEWDNRFKRLLSSRCFTRQKENTYDLQPFAIVWLFSNSSLLESSALGNLWMSHSCNRGKLSHVHCLISALTPSGDSLRLIDVWVVPDRVNPYKKSSNFPIRLKSCLQWFSVPVSKLLILYSFLMWVLFPAFTVTNARLELRHHVYQKVGLRGNHVICTHLWFLVWVTMTVFLINWSRWEEEPQGFDVLTNRAVMTVSDEYVMSKDHENIWMTDRRNEERKAENRRCLRKAMKR